MSIGETEKTTITSQPFLVDAEQPELTEENSQEIDICHLAQKCLATLALMISNSVLSLNLLATKLTGCTVITSIFLANLAKPLHRLNTRLAAHAFEPFHVWAVDIAQENQLIADVNKVLSFKDRQLFFSPKNYKIRLHDSFKAIMFPIALAVNALSQVAFWGFKPAYIVCIGPGLVLDWAIVPLLWANKKINRLTYETPLVLAADKILEWNPMWKMLLHDLKIDPNKRSERKPEVEICSEDINLSAAAKNCLDKLSQTFKQVIRHVTIKKCMATFALMITNSILSLTLTSVKLTGFTVIPTLLMRLAKPVFELNQKLGAHGFDPFRNWANALHDENERIVKTDAVVYMKNGKLLFNLNNYKKCVKDSCQAAIAPISLTVNAACLAIFSAARSAYLGLALPGVMADIFTLPIMWANKLISNLTYEPLARLSDDLVNCQINTLKIFRPSE